MKKKTVLFLLITLLSSCTPQVSANTLTPTNAVTSSFTPTITRTPRPTLTPKATLIPCPPPETPIIIDDIQIYFDNGVPQNECNLFIIYTQKFNIWMKQNGYKTGSIRVSVFSDDQTVTDFIYDWAFEHGCNPDSKANLFALWSGMQEGTQAMSTYGASFYQVFNGTWELADLNEKLVGIIGEEVNVAHFNYAGSCQRVWLIPDWFQDSGAALAVQIIPLWGIEPADWTDWWNSNPECKTMPLAQTRAGHPCLYLNSRHAFKLLTNLYGEKSFQVFELVGKGLNFKTAFHETYGISISDFYKAYDEYRASGFGATATSTQPPIDTGISGKITWSASYPSQAFSTYILNFCPKKGGDCLGATEIQSDGSFLQSLPPGYYLISLNSKDGGQPIGWYSINGVVKENICAEVVRVKDNEFTKIAFFVASPIQCP